MRGSLTRVHARQRPLGEIYLLDARVEDVDSLDFSDKESDGGEWFCFGLRTRYSNYYFVVDNLNDKDKWMFFIVQASNTTQLLLRTETERYIAALRESNFAHDDPMLRSSVLSFDAEPLAEPLTTLPSKTLEDAALELNAAVRQFIATTPDAAPSGSHKPYELHVQLAKTVVGKCLSLNGLQNEAYCQLIKLSNNPANPDALSCVRCWMLFALTLGIFLPARNYLGYVKQHVERHKRIGTEVARHAKVCQAQLKRTLNMRGRSNPPSRMEVVAVLTGAHLERPTPMSVVVYLMDGTCLELGFDASSTAAELVRKVNKMADMRPVSLTGFALYREDRSLRHDEKLADKIASWEAHTPDIDVTLALTFKRRLYLPEKNRIGGMNDMVNEKERRLLYCQAKEDIVGGRFPISDDLAIQLAALQAQIDVGDCMSGGKAHDVTEPIRNALPRDMVSGDKIKKVVARIGEQVQRKWASLQGKPAKDCIRDYMTRVSTWPFYGATLFSCTCAQPKGGGHTQLWLAVQHDGITELSVPNMSPVQIYKYPRVLSFGGGRHEFTLVIRGVRNGPGPAAGDPVTTERISYAMSTVRGGAARRGGRCVRRLMRHAAAVRNSRKRTKSPGLSRLTLMPWSDSRRSHATTRTRTSWRRSPIASEPRARGRGRTGARGGVRVAGRCGAQQWNGSPRSTADTMSG